METIEKNRLIAQFMGCEPTPDALDRSVLAYYIGDVIINADNSKNENDENVFHPEDMQFHTDWNWLMPVIDKIESMGYWVDYTKGDVFIYDDNYNLVIPNPMHENEDTKLSIHYKAVVEFINWYNNKQ
jgi:hypothetical protein